MGWVVVGFSPEIRTDKKVAVVGSGPSGLVLASLSVPDIMLPYLKEMIESSY